VADHWVKVLPDGSASIEVDTDPTFSDAVPEAWFSILVYIPSTAQTAMNGYNPTTWYFLQSDDATLGIKHISGTSYDWSHNNSATGIAVTFDQWLQVEWHSIAGSSTIDFWLNGTHHTFTAAAAPTGINFFNAGAIVPTGTDGTDWVGYDELAYSLTGRVSVVGADYLWSLEDTVDPLGDAAANYPTPPFSPFILGRLSLQADGGGAALCDTLAGEQPNCEEVTPSGCCADPGELQALVFIDDTDVTSVSNAGSWTPQLNGIAQATVTIAMDAAIGDCGSLLRIEIWDGVSEPCIVFHGRILNRELDTDKDGGRVVYNAQDASEILQYRVVRDDDGDFSKPRVIEQYVTGPQIIEAVLQNSIDSTGRTSLDLLPGGPPPVQSEGPLPIEFGGFAGGGPNMAGAPVDWPMKISELMSLLVSTGQVDCIFTPINPGGGITNRIDVYNGNYGTDRSATVGFEYGTGRFNAASIRWNRDMTTVVNKYQIFAGPQIQTAADPKGEQHWCFNVTGTDGGSAHVPPFTGGLVYPPGGQSVDATNTPVGPPWTNNQLGERIYNSRQDFDVRMQVDILDAYDENCIRHFGTPGRMLTRYQWQVFSWLSAQPRELIHITPVAGTQIGCFDIGDLIHVEAVADVLGGFSGKQRVYGYTVSWEATPSVLTLSEIQTSADNEGSFNA
jgi:hypothetical protein